MKLIYLKTFVFLFVIGALSACTNKRMENNIKSLEKRVAALEAKNGINSAPASTSAQPVATTTSTDVSKMTFESLEFDFGSVNAGDVVDHTFKFRNTGNFPLIISKANATCGCTVPNWPKDPIAPGATGEIKVKFNSKGRSNLQTKYVNITANTKPEVTRLKITGNVIAAQTNG